MAMKTMICLLFIVLNKFFAKMCLKKNCASPTRSLTARHWYNVPPEPPLVGPIRMSKFSHRF